MKTAQFTNFTDQDFTGWWDGKSREFPSGSSTYMPDYLAQHYAKHLVNRELLKTKRDGTLIYKGGDKMTSPKFPEQVPLYMELFNQACTVMEEETTERKKDDVDTLIDVAQKNMQERKEKSKDGVQSKKEKQDPTKPQTVVPPDFDQEE